MLRKKTQIYTKPRPTGPSLPVGTAHMSVYIIEYNSGTLYSTAQFVMIFPVFLLLWSI